MDRVSSTVTRELIVEVVSPAGAPVHVPVVFRYDIADPFAIEAVFRPEGHESVPWFFARELLMHGITGPAGEGDVRVRPASCGGTDVLRIALMSPDGEALLQIPVDEVVDFLSCTYSVCRRGEEAQYLDVDRALRELLAF